MTDTPDDSLLHGIHKDAGYTALDTRILGMNSRSHPARNSQGYISYQVVLWRSYTGIRASIGDCNSVGPSTPEDEEWVARNGDPISFHEVKTHFPGLNDEVEKHWET